MEILLIGDSCIDKYIYGVVERLNPELPVPLLTFKYTEIKQGMASNVENNLLNLGCKVQSILGPQSMKTRIVDFNSHYQFLRFDQDTDINKPLEFDKLPNLSFNAIVISDYDKGFVSYQLIEKLVKVFTQGPIFVDTKKTDLKRLEGCYVKINEKEKQHAKTLCSNVIVTTGKNGATYNEKVYTANEQEIIDVCGAGDTFLAALAYKFVDTNDIELAIQFAIKASLVTIRHRGVYAPTLEEIK